MEYNTQREKLKIPDYGRNVAKLIEVCKGIGDRDERNRMAETIVDVMAQVNPKVKERSDYRHTLWDHMMFMADYELDVDSPYPVRREEPSQMHPNTIHRSDSEIRYRHYGRALEDMVRAVAEMPDGEERRLLTQQIAGTMKRMYLQWNRDSVDDELIKEQLYKLSEGRLVLPESFRFRDSKEYLDAMATSKKEQNQKKKKKKKNNNGKL